MNTTTNSNTFNTETNVGEQTMNNTAADQELFITIASLGSFFIDITEYICEKKQGDAATTTARDIAIYALNAAESEDIDCLNSISGVIDLMADLGWLDIHVIGTTFDDELLYEFKG